MSLPPISETQLVAIALLMLACGAVIGFILGSLWMEQRVARRSMLSQALQSKSQVTTASEAHPEEPVAAAQPSADPYKRSA